MMSLDTEKKRQWGSVIFENPGDLPAGSYQTVVLRFVVGSLGIDEHGGIRVSFRFVSDFGAFQFADPKADNYVTATTKSGQRLELSWANKGNVRPFQKTLFLHVLDGSLRQGDEIKVVFGDTGGGSRGWQIQTFFEYPFPLRVEADPFGTHSYVVLPEQPGFNIVAGAPHLFQLHLPSLAEVGEPFTLRVKCEDIWGNPLRELRLRPAVTLLADGGGAPAGRLEIEPRHEEGVLFYDHPGFGRPGVYRFAIADGETRGGMSNPLVVTEKGSRHPYRKHWCDLHGQTGETVGTGTVEGYFRFGRHFGFLDGSCHQANDFQVDGPTWARIVRAGNSTYEPGHFVTFNGIEWSGTTPMGGDHNVLFNEEHPPLYRSTGWLASDGEPMEEVAPLARLYEVLKQHDAMTIPHIGGRPAELETTDPELERLVELHSAWGTFEWVYTRAFAKGFKVGFVCNSDGHKQRPGASYPGASKFGTLGGLTCVLAEAKTRAAFWQALKARRCYGTTGQRIWIDCHAEGREMGSDLTVPGPFAIRGQVHGTAPLLGVDLLRESEVIATAAAPALARPAGADAWVLVRLGGARVYGRGRQVDWQGSLRLEGNRLLDARMHGLFNPSKGIRSRTEQGLTFDFITTGNSLNFCLRLKTPGQGRLWFESKETRFELDLASLDTKRRVLYEAPIDRFAEVSACPIGALPLSLPFDFQAPPPSAPQTPYFIRVRQLDEGKAWTSPFYVTRA